MTCESLVNRHWKNVVDRLSGAASLESSARDTKAFLLRGDRKRRRSPTHGFSLLSWCEELTMYGRMGECGRPRRHFQRRVALSPTSMWKLACCFDWQDVGF